MIILIPAYQPSRNLVEYVQELKQRIACDIIIVNDGSNHSFDSIFETLALYGTVLHHDINQGKGVALKYGFSYILKYYPKCTGVITVDADGQHAIADVVGMANMVKKNADEVIFGVRDFYSHTVPWKNKLGNRMTTFLCKIKYHRKVSDTQTGLRFYPKKLLSELLIIEGNRYEYEFAILIFLFQKKKSIIELPIETIYLEEETPSNFRRIQDSYRIYKMFFQRRK